MNDLDLLIKNVNSIYSLSGICFIAFAIMCFCFSVTLLDLFLSKHRKK